MIHAIIIEDEKPARDLLVKYLMESSKEVHVEAKLTSVEEGKKYMAQEHRADIIFSDIQLADGYSFEIFKNLSSEIPVVFTTGFNEYMMNAFHFNGIDYLLKPISRDDIENALQKYLNFKNHFTTKDAKLEKLIHHFENRKKTRLLVRRGLEHIALKMDDIVLLYTENKMVFVLDNKGNKFIGDKNLTEMEMDLDDSVFFRTNRQYIVNINYIKGYKPYEKVKLLVAVDLPDISHKIIVSQEQAPVFRKWMYEA
ncbi:MAG: LytTR family DNA-binding domain-containing protein [Chitinophagaceae bacterium]|nr:response regulator transcription factor [Chitinophagaceae bacterium]